MEMLKYINKLQNIGEIMLEIYIWVISFIALYVSVFWIIVSSYNKSKKILNLKYSPYVTIAIPVWNEEKTVIGTLKSLIGLDYDRNKLQIIVVNDGSTDKTKNVVEDFLNENKGLKHIKLINQKNKGKAGALNTALKITNSEYFAVFDADSIANSKALKLMLPYFDSDKIGAVITPIKVADPKTVIEKIQRIEYIFSSFVRKLMSNIGTLHTTHGVLSIFRTDVLKKLGGFDENKNMTEDYEIAMRLRKNHYQIVLCEENINYTKVPDNLKSLWFQRVRWFRGFMFNGIKYKEIVMGKRYGLLGGFQIPLEILTLFIVFFSFGFMGYQIFRSLYNFIIKVYISRMEIFYINIPTIKEFILRLNFKIYFPFIATLIAALYLYIMAHRYVDEKWKFHLASFIYLFLYPAIRSTQWIHALILEIFRAKEKWR